MSVLFLLPNWSTPSEVWAVRMLEGLETDLSYIATRQPPERLWHGHVPFVDLEPPDGPSRRIARSLGVSLRHAGERRLERAVRSPRVSVVFAQFLHECLRYERVWSRTSKPVFCHCHGGDVTWNLRDPGPGSAPVHPPDYPQRVRRLSERVTLIANSIWCRDQLTSVGVSPLRIVLRRFGIPRPEQFPERPSRGGRVRILFVGRLVDAKGPDLLIRAFEIACDRGLDGELIIAGDGPLGPMCALLRARSSRRDRIHLLGSINRETASRLRLEADIFSAHSCCGPVSQQEEAFGVAFAEAMAAGLPIVTGRSGGLTEYLEDGQTATLFDAGDVEAHASALLHLAAAPDERRAMGLRAWQAAGKLFPLQNDGPRLKELLGVARSSREF